MLGGKRVCSRHRHSPARSRRHVTDQADSPAGHAIAATIAELYLDPTVLPILCSILNPTDPGTSCSLASVASWADEIKRKKPWSSQMHYVNPVADHPPQLCLFPGAKGWEGKTDVNVLGAIRNTTDLLGRWVQEGSNPEDLVASEALKFLIHFVGDLHMPFHLVARAQGANEVFVRWGTRKTRKHSRLQLFVGHSGKIELFVGLHAMWDVDLVERAIQTTPGEWDQPLDQAVESHLHGDDYDPLIRKTLTGGIDKTWASEVDSWIQCPAVGTSQSHGGGPSDQTTLQSQWQPSDTDDESVCPWHWASPIHQITCDWAWPKQLDEPPYDEPQGPLLQLDTKAYGGKVTQEWVVEKLLAMAGLRLAAILNLVFAHPQA